MKSDNECSPGDIPPSQCCYAHNFPYFRDPVHPYDYSEDWELEAEWNARQTRVNPCESSTPHPPEK